LATLIGIAKTSNLLAEMKELTEARIEIDSGLQGDARGTKRQRQISILFEDDWKDACNELGANLSWLTRRANLFVSGMRAPREPGTRITIGNVDLEVRVETEPCDLMDKQHQGLRATLENDWRGGVCCSVRKPGNIKIGNDVKIVSDS
jgi:MOSC domain-containing protein YiiM